MYNIFGNSDRNIRLGTNDRSYNYGMKKLKNEMESYVRIEGKGFEKPYVPLYGGRGNHNLPQLSLRS